MPNHQSFVRLDTGLGTAPPVVPGLQPRPILEPVFFAEGRHTLDLGSEQRLDELAGVLDWFTTAGIVEVRGHAWEEGDSTEAQELSLRRSETVVRYLESRGVLPGMLIAKGLGSSRPQSRPGMGALRLGNRRVEFWLHQQGFDLPATPCVDPGGSDCCRHC